MNIFNRILLLCGSLFLFNSPSFAENGCVGDCVNGKGIYTNDDIKYEGSFKNEKYDGKGILTYKDFSGSEAKYEGEFKNGQYEGQGTLVAEGWKYVGGFKNSMYQGQGTLTTEDGKEHKAQFDQGLPVDKDGNMLEFK
jgi:hypothetical protein